MTFELDSLLNLYMSKNYLDDIELRDEPPYFEAYAGEGKTLFDL